jgi:hypothetical protein
MRAGANEKKKRGPTFFPPYREPRTIPPPPPPVPEQAEEVPAGQTPSDWCKQQRPLTTPFVLRALGLENMVLERQRRVRWQPRATPWEPSPHPFKP